ncbi:hypothetical protein CPB84DRAFT_1865160 [Gymnopilus junonius]|uniref:BBC1/AIM3 cysteine proteinase-fold domain-containing protein n=1 Tax=Gymnopilus junonius TaxID=109634 RepID=A0A9P5NFQ5_GYMJU|nr:hypothetical protein CPB84DRAFT_1865160 [Gymnopilus junonius]
MSDQSPPPPKPKPGSLRDRIAAFEKSASTAAPPAPAPVPRPKPAGFASWKPKAPSPPESPSAGTTEHAASSPRVGGMSATDAKESITKAGSLKDRMAALQGKGAFGAPSPPVAPKPAVERPKWKPPPVALAPADDDDHTGASPTADIAAAVEQTISPPVSVNSGEIVDTLKGPEEGAEPTALAADSVDGDHEGPPPEANPEEEERQRRAAIAARMARLGGARVGMAPPVFGKKPPVRRPTQEDVPKPEEPTKSDVPSVEAAKSTEVQSPPAEPIIVASPPVEAPADEQDGANIRQSPEYFPVHKDSENASVLSAESAGSQGARSPPSMPIPAVPRRSGPPRKKPAKAVPPPPPEVGEEKAEDIAPPPVAPEEGKTESQQPAVEAESAVSETVLPEKQKEVKELTEEAVEPKLLDAVQKEDAHETAIKEETTTVEMEEQKPLSISYETKSPSAKEPTDILPPPSHATEPEEVEAEDELEEMEDFITSTSPPAPFSLPQQVIHDATIDEPKDKGHHEIGPASAAAVEVSEESEEAEEEARKKRVAERLAKMGGINPFALPPPQVKSPPAPPAVAQHEQHREVLLLSHDEGLHNAEEKKIVESAAEEEAFDASILIGFPTFPSRIEDEAEEGDLRDEPERPLTPPLPHAEPIASQWVSGLDRLRYLQRYEQDDDDASDYGDAESDQDQHAPARPPRPLSISARPPTFSSAPLPSGRDIGPPSTPVRPPQHHRRVLMPQTSEPDEEDEDEDEGIDEELDERLASSQLFVPPPSVHRPIAIPRHVQAEAEEDGDGSESDVPALPVPHRRSMEIPLGRSIPPPPPIHGSLEEDSEPESDHDGQALPIPPRHSTGPRVVPSLPPPQAPASHSPPVPRDIPPAPRLDIGLSPSSPLTPTVSISGSEEILDEEEGDPIDPSFHSPSRRTSFASIHAMAQAQSQEGQSEAENLSLPYTLPSPPVPPAVPPPAMAQISSEQTVHPEEDAEQLRRKTIAERMAKLGGIRFGAAPLPTPASHPAPPVHRQEEKEEEGESASVAEEQPTAALSEEEEERARKERIAAKLASMGGMRIGMMPMGVGGLPPQRSHVLREEASNPPAPPPAAAPVRAVPPARPPPPPAPAPSQPQPDTDSEYGSAAASDDGVKVEAEESEMEEVGYEDAQEGHEEEAPPPVPSRAGRAPSRQVSVDKPTTPIAPPLPSPRPPVPSAMPGRRSSVQTSRSSTSNSGIDSSAQRKSSAFMPPTQSEYVMVEEPEQQEILLSPARTTSRVPPARSMPQVPPAMTASRTSDAHEWELPSIPTANFDFGESADLSLSWTDAGESTFPTASIPHPPAPAKRFSHPPAPPAAERQMSADDLIALWGRVGVQVCEAATTLFEKSKKTLIGDGTYSGFIRSVLAAVPNAAAIPNPEFAGYGYLIYAQNGGAVQKRVSEIMPGDIVEIHDAKFKGHKGLQTYHQNVGGVGGEVLVGVVGEVEAKKSKIRVFQANQHVGQQTVESVSYRLEDLKSGIVKIYRVLDA